MSEPSSLVRYANRTTSRDKNVYWDRVGIDGVPFRGKQAPIMPQREYDDRVRKIADFNNGFFDVTVFEENHRYCLIMECVANGWYKLVMKECFWQGTTKHYVEWLEFFMEDGTPTAAAESHPWEANQ